MAVQSLTPVEEYLRTSYSPDREYCDGVLVERNVGDKAHARLQMLLGLYLGKREDDWNIEVFTEMRIRARQGWYPIPDVCAYVRPAPDENVPTRMPLLWIEILSPGEDIRDVWDKTRRLVECGCPYVWVIDPMTLESQLRTAAGMASVPGQTLQLPGSPVVIPLADVVKKK